MDSWETAKTRLASLKPSITDMGFDQAMDLIGVHRSNRMKRPAPLPKTLESSPKKVKAKKPPTMKETVRGLDKQKAAALLALILKSQMKQ